jgi:choline transport protein
MSRIDHRFNVPVNAILAVALFNVLFGLLYLGPAVAFNAYISSCTIFLNCSYAGPNIILLVRGRETIVIKRPDFPLGRIGGYLLNYIAVIYVVVTSAVSGLRCHTLHKCLLTALRSFSSYQLQQLSTR